MEQKKILWIVVVVGTFLLFITGAAFILYSSPRSSSVATQPAAIARPQAPAVGSTVDPDAWSREPGKVPGLDTAAPTPTGINLTIVNGDNAAANYGTFDVSGLTKSPATVPAPTDSTAQTTVTTTVTTTAAAETKVENTTTSKPEGKQTTVVATPKKTTKAPTEKPRAESKKAQTKTVTEYWIQTGSFASKLNAEKVRSSLTAKYLAAEIFTKQVSGKMTYRVRVGPYANKKEADYWLGTLRDSPDFKGSYVSEVKARR